MNLETGLKLLNAEQRHAFDLMTQGKNVFLTGSAGTGKSLVIRLFRDFCREKKRVIAVTSTTGVSALMIGGTTVHSYLGIGLGQKSVQDLSRTLLTSRYSSVRKRWTDVQTLVIDEISMMSPALFDKIEELARILRRPHPQSLLPMHNTEKEKEEPFGGIQLVLSGDFLQLPVVNCDQFCFEAKTWTACVPNVVHLTEIMRQTDVEFQTILDDLRYGNVTERAKKLLSERVGVLLTNNLGIQPTRIYTTNEKVDAENNQALSALLDQMSEGKDAKDEPEYYEYTMIIDGKDKFDNENIRKYCVAPERLALCKGAQVMLLYNLDLEIGLANGSRGVVTGFEQEFPRVRFTNGTEHVIGYHDWEIDTGKKHMINVCQVPLRLAWVMTVHKSQSMTLDYVEVDLSNVFEHGQAYVALSRVKSLNGLSISKINYGRIRANPKAVKFYTDLKAREESVQKSKART